MHLLAYYSTPFYISHFIYHIKLFQVLLWVLSCGFMPLWVLSCGFMPLFHALNLIGHESEQHLASRPRVISAPMSPILIVSLFILDIRRHQESIDPHAPTPRHPSQVSTQIAPNRSPGGGTSIQGTYMPHSIRNWMGGVKLSGPVDRIGLKKE